MVKISTIDKIKFTKKGMDILRDLKKNPEKQTKLIKALKANGFEDIAELAQDATKYLDEVV